MKSRPTSEDLMMFVDGELDPARAAEVEAFVQSDEDARATVEGLRVAGEIVSGAALEAADRAGAGDIADRVMRAVEAGGAGVTDLVEHRRAKSRRPLVIAGAAWGAAAVAAAVAFWVNGPKINSLGEGPAPMTMKAVGSVIADSVAAMAPSASAEVDAVDFGARAGSIFYVPSDGVGVTAVVWLTDDEAGATSGERR
jgi:anti-sigma factor RsiW